MADQKINPTVTISFSDGSEATWFLDSDDVADDVSWQITLIAGQPDSIKC